VRIGKRTFRFRWRRYNVYSRSELDPFTRLVLEAERTIFNFYGCKTIDGRPMVYSKMAHSLSEAFTDLEENEGMSDEGYSVQDAFVEKDEDGFVTVHVQLRSVADAIEDTI
jgi:hypothetical protein